MRFALTTLLVLASGEPLSAQLKRPDSWKVRLDAGQTVPDSTLEYVSMPPGWHVTTNKHSGIFYDPAWKASGSYRLHSTIFLFPNSKQEGYGLFLAGRDLDGAAQSYLYFLLRSDGKYLIKHRDGDKTRELVPWTEDAAIVKQPGGNGDPVRNVLTVEAKDGTLRFLVNGKQVAAQSSSAASNGAGQVGLRLNHGINVHVTDVKVEPLP